MMLCFFLKFFFMFKFNDLNKSVQFHGFYKIVKENIWILVLLFAHFEKLIGILYIKII